MKITCDYCNLADKEYQNHLEQMQGLKFAITHSRENFSYIHACPVLTARSIKNQSVEDLKECIKIFKKMTVLMQEEIRIRNIKKENE